MPLKMQHQVALLRRVTLLRQSSFVLRAALEDRMEEVEKIIGIPDSQRAFGIFALGYPAEERTQQDRYDETRIHRVTRG